MKKNLPVTDTETQLSEHNQLVTATDLKGQITYCNQEFIEISGFSEEELMGSSHNIVRHPDMPIAAFEDLWASLKDQKPWLGIVKNRCKNGNYYWVEAFVTPVFENNQVVGYESVRVKPQADSIIRAEALYVQLNKGNRKKLPTLELSTQLGLMMGFISLLVAFVANIFSGVGLMTLVSIGIASTTLAWLGSRLLLSNLSKAVASAEKIVNNPITQHVMCGINNDAGKILVALQMERAKLRTVLGRVDASIDGVTKIALETATAANNISNQIDQQQQNVSALATAMEEMSASVTEVANSATSVSESAKLANDDSELGKQAVAEATSTTETVAEEVSKATFTIQQLERESEAIDAVLVVIRGIAEQTNLLALNAAIEAARAGEQGRGFAVVADEVRTLASRTQSSTEEIQGMIEKLQENSRSAVKAMESSSVRVDQSVEKTLKVGQSFDQIFHRVVELNKMNVSIAEATSEQSVVASEISKNVYSISNASDQLSVSASATSEASAHLADLSSSLRSVVTRFKA